MNNNTQSDGEKYQKCPSCDGWGKRCENKYEYGISIVPIKTDCVSCKGTGLILISNSSEAGKEESFENWHKREMGAYPNSDSELCKREREVWDYQQAKIHSLQSSLTLANQALDEVQESLSKFQKICYRLTVEEAFILTGIMIQRIKEIKEKK